MKILINCAKLNFAPFLILFFNVGAETEVRKANIRFPCHSEGEERKKLGSFEREEQPLRNN